MKRKEKFRKKLVAYFNKKYGRPLPSSIQEMLRAADNFKEAHKQFQLINKYLPLKRKMCLLDAGCGLGYFVSYCLKQGYDCRGFEVKRELVNIAQEFLKIKGQDHKRITFVKDNRTAYPGESFDFINLHYVLDYVKDIPHLMKELKRILKKDGSIFIVCPNYQCCYSPVYALFFIPWLPKKINRLYFNLIGVPQTKFFENLTFTTPGYLENSFRQLKFDFKVFGPDHWQKTTTEQEFYKRADFLRFLIKLINKVKLTRFLALTNKLGFYTPLIYILRKKK